MGIRAGLGPRRGGGIRERLEVRLRARAGAAATASLGDGAGRKGLDWVRKTRMEGRGRRGGDATHGGKERERRARCKEDEEEKGRDLFIFFILISFLVVANLVWAAGGRREAQAPGSSSIYLFHSLTRIRSCIYVSLVRIHFYRVHNKYI